MVDEYNKLVEERRYPEAEIVAKRAAEVDPDNPVVIQMVTVSKQLRRMATDIANIPGSIRTKRLSTTLSGNRRCGNPVLRRSVPNVRYDCARNGNQL